MGKAPLGAPGQPNYGNEMMRMLALLQEAKYNKERAAYYGASKESEIAARQANIEKQTNARLDTESQREFSQQTGLPFKPGVDEPAVAPLRAAKQAALPPMPDVKPKEDPSLWSKMFGPTKHTVVPPPGEDPSITAGREMGVKAAMVPTLYEGAQRRVADMGYGDPRSPMYSPETVRAAGSTTMRPEDVDKLAHGVGVQKEQAAKAKTQQLEAATKQLGLTAAEENRQLTIAYGSGVDKKTQDAILRRIALNQGHTGNVVQMDKEKREGYLAATNKANDAYEKLLKAQKDVPDKIDFHASLAREATAANLAASEIENSPMTDLVTALPYNAKMPFGSKYTQSNRVKVPTDYAKAERDGVVEAMLRAPINPNDSDEAQIAQMNKQGSYFAWKIIQQNPEYLGNPVAFEAAVDNNPSIAAYLKPIAKQHMGLYMQMNQDPRSEVDKRAQDNETALGPPNPDTISLPGGKDLATGEPLPGPGVSPSGVIAGIKRILPTSPEGGMFGTGKGVEDYIKEDQGTQFPASQDAPPDILAPAPVSIKPSAQPQGPTGPVGPTKGSNLPTLSGVPKAGASKVERPSFVNPRVEIGTDGLKAYEFSWKTVQQYVDSGAKVDKPADAQNFGEWFAEMVARRVRTSKGTANVDAIVKELAPEMDAMRRAYRRAGGH